MSVDASIPSLSIEINAPAEEVTENLSTMNAQAQQTSFAPNYDIKEDENHLYQAPEDRSNEPIKIFVGQVPHAYNEEDLEREFHKFGTILRVQIIRDKQSMMHKGMALVLQLSD